MLLYEVMCFPLVNEPLVDFKVYKEFFVFYMHFRPSVGSCHHGMAHPLGLQM